MDRFAILLAAAMTMLAPGSHAIAVDVLAVCAADGSAAATREKTVQSGIAACAQGTTLGMSVLPNCPRFSHVSLCRPLSRRLLGTRPAHVSGELPPVPNDAAILTRIWAPEIDAGYVPQGVAVAEGAVLVSSYRSTDPLVGRGPCRVHRIDPASGHITGWFDMPPACGHAGGLAYLGRGMLLVADTRRLYKVDMARALAGRSDAVIATLNLGGEMKGSLAGFDGKSIFIASSEKDMSRARAFFLPPSLFDSHDGALLTPSDASRSFAIPALAQGAAFDRDGGLWMSFSNSKTGALKKLDPDSGAVLASHDMVIGVEGIAFDGQGQLWSVSEAGSLRWSSWSHSYPVLFAMDPALLR